MSPQKNHNQRIMQYAIIFFASVEISRNPDPGGIARILQSSPSPWYSLSWYQSVGSDPFDTWIIRVSDSVCEPTSWPRLPNNLINNPPHHRCGMAIAQTNFGDHVESSARAFKFCRVSRAQFHTHTSARVDSSNFESLLHASNHVPPSEVIFPFHCLFICLFSSFFLSHFRRETKTIFPNRGEFFWIFDERSREEFLGCIRNYYIELLEPQIIIWIFYLSLFFLDFKSRTDLVIKFLHLKFILIRHRGRNHFFSMRSIKKCNAVIPKVILIILI